MKIRSVLVLFITVILMLTATSCGRDPSIPEGYQLVSGDDVAYRFYVPTQWNKNNSGTSYSAFYSAGDKSMVMVNFFYPDSDNTDIDTFWAGVEEEYKAQYKDYTLIEGRVAVTLGTRPAYSYTFTANINGKDYKVMQVYTGYGSYYYALTYMSTPEKFDSHLEDVNGIMNVFEFR